MLLWGWFWQIRGFLCASLAMSGLPRYCSKMYNRNFIHRVLQFVYTMLLTVDISHVLGQVPSRFLFLDQQGIVSSTKCNFQE